jgi:glycosyltransferase involved in cell wall biosynthesis
MEIGFITPFFSPVAGGSATAPYYLAKQLVKRGHKVLIFTSSFGRSLSKFSEEEDLIIMESKIKLNLAGLLYTPSFNSMLESHNKLDLLHFHNFRTYQNYVAYTYAKKTNTPYVLQARGSIPRIGKKVLKWIYDVFFGYRLLKGASKVIALTQVEAEQYKHMGVPEEKIAIIPNGIDLSEYAEMPPKGSFRRKYSITEDKKVILYLGRIHKIKGIDILVRAYAYAVKNLGLRNTLLILAGPDDGYLGELKQLISSLKVSNVLLIGPLYAKDKLEAYVDADAFVLPSRYETFPNVVLEAYACFKPVIAPNIMSIPDIVINGRTGLLFRTGDAEDLAKKIAYTLSHTEESKKMGNEARKFVEENLSIDKVVVSLEKTYEEIVKREK